MTHAETDLDMLDRLLETGQITERQYVAYIQRQEGWTLQEIAGYLYCSHTTVHRDLGRVEVALAVEREEAQEGSARAGITIRKDGEVKTVQDTPLQQALWRLRHRRCADYRKRLFLSKRMYANG